MKTCSKCDQPGEFYRDASRRDGLSSNCRLCIKARVRRYRESAHGAAVTTLRYYSNLAGSREKSRENYHSHAEARKRQSRAYLKSKRGRAATRAHRAGVAHKTRARNAVYRAIRAGKLVRLPCENCGNEKSHAHHRDYAKPLDVSWLCAACHGAVHVTLNLTGQ